MTKTPVLTANLSYIAAMMQQTEFYDDYRLFLKDYYREQKMLR